MPTKIVIVDAEPVVRSAVAAIMQTDGYEVIQTDDPTVVLDIVQAGPLALIITNVALPGITGHDAMRIFKEYAPDIPVLMISGLPDVDIIREWKGEPGFGVFPKPFRADELKQESGPSSPRLDRLKPDARIPPPCFRLIERRFSELPGGAIPI